MAEDFMSRSTHSQEDEDDLDRRIAEAEFLLAREQALQAARNTYHSVLSHLAQPPATSNSESMNELVPAQACNVDQLSSAPEEYGERAGPSSPPMQPAGPSHMAAASMQPLSPDPVKQQHPVPQSKRGRRNWSSSWYPLLLCLSILTIPAEWAALKQADVETLRSVHRLWFLIASQVVLSFLGASQPSRLAPTHVTVHVALRVSVLGSWVLSALSYVRSMTHNVEQELAIVLSFMRVLLSLNVGKRAPVLTVLALGVTLVRCFALVPQATLQVDSGHVLLASAAAAFCWWMLHQLCSYAEPRPLKQPPPCAGKWELEEAPGQEQLQHDAAMEHMGAPW